MKTHIQVHHHSCIIHGFTREGRNVNGLTCIRKK